MLMTHTLSSHQIMLTRWSWSYNGMAASNNFNNTKTEELIIHRPKVEHPDPPTLLPGVERVHLLNILAVMFQSNLSFIEHMVTKWNKWAGTHVMQELMSKVCRRSKNYTGPKDLTRNCLWIRELGKFSRTLCLTRKAFPRNFSGIRFIFLRNVRGNTSICFFPPLKAIDDSLYNCSVILWMDPGNSRNTYSVINRSLQFYVIQP